MSGHAVEPPPGFSREVGVPRPRLRRGFVFALVATVGIASIAAMAGQRCKKRAKQVGWYQKHAASCNSLEVDVALRDATAMPADRATCLAVAGRITQARAILDAMPPAQRDETVGAIFSIAHPIADAGDDRSAGPIMGLVVEYQPGNYMAVFHAGMAEFALGHDDVARKHLEHFLAIYQQRDLWRQRAETAITDITTERPLDEREAHFAE
jgi:hypothetical protein